MNDPGDAGNRSRTQTSPPSEVPTGRAISDSRSGRLRSGAALGRYVVVDVLGAGAMGVVYDAYDPDLERRVALKAPRRVIPSRPSCPTPFRAA